MVPGFECTPLHPVRESAGHQIDCLQDLQSSQLLHNNLSVKGVRRLRVVGLLLKRMNSKKRKTKARHYLNASHKVWSRMNQDAE